MLTGLLKLRAGVLLSCVMLAALTPGNAGAEEARAPFPEIKSPAPRWAGGQHAINVLGGNLPSIAEWYGKTADALSQELLRDPNLRIDEQGRLFATGRAQPGRIPTPPVGFAQPVIEGVFDLHSKPGAPKAIVLDFQGADVTNSRWNGPSGSAINAPAFDTDGQPGFSQQELRDIRTIWQRVAEDFAPFDVDVTTARPGPDMDANSIRVIVTTAVPSMCSKGAACRFLAYVDSFGSGEPAFVFGRSLNHGNEKSVAEAISHVVGRTLGLGPDGIKDGAARYAGLGAKGKGWAPIMGNSSFQETSVFDNGSYAGATNTEDDFAVIQRHLALRPDDAGNTVADATPLAPEALGNGRMRSSLRGVIERPSDFDAYAFTANVTSGPATLSVTFDASASSDDGKIVKYSWDFGDGSAEGLLRHYGQDIKNQDTPIIGHYFFKPGTYDVTLTVTDDKGQVSSPARQTITVTVPNQPPVANHFSSEVRMGARHTVDFDASNSTDDVGIVSYRWEWGDGGAPTETTEPTVTHVFPSSGSFVVYLTVTDKEGLGMRRGNHIYVPRGMQPSIEVVPHFGFGSEIMVHPMLNGGYTADTRIFITDGLRNKLAGAEIHWTLEGSETASGTAMTNEKGTAWIDLPLPKSRAEYGALCLKLTIESVSKPSWHYEPVSKPVRTYCPPTVIADRPVIQVTGTNGAAVATATVAVRDNHGNPAPGVLVTGQWPGLEPNVSATTDASGVATLQVSSASQSCFGFMLGAISKPGFASAETPAGFAVECLPGTEPEVTIQ